jgi:hypothetical protein
MHGTLFHVYQAFFAPHPYLMEQRTYLMEQHTYLMEQHTSPT